MSDNFSGRAPLVAVTGSLPLGGSSTFLVNLARAFRRRGLILPIIVLDPENAYAPDFQAIGNPVHCLPHRRFIYEDRVRWSYEQAARYAPRAVLSCLSSESFEILRLVPEGVLRMSIVQSDDPGPYGTVAAFGAWTDVVVGVSNQIAEKLRAMPALSRARVEAIPYGIDFPSKPPREKRSAREPLRIIYLGRLIEEQKRISRIGELAKMLETHDANVEFTIVGDGPQRASLQADLRDCRRVQLREAVPYDQVTALLSQQDVFVLLSDFEGLPLSLLEAMGCGVVPVVSDLPSGLAEVVNDSRGIRVSVGDVTAAAQAITELSQDRAKLDRCSESCADFVRAHYSAEAMASRYIRLVPEDEGSEIVWPRANVPVPLGVKHKWMFAGLPRLIRRWVKRFSA
jgi:glycosyltransferase involved in cell wall biosynthesis